MGLGMEVVTGRVLNPGATITALTANTGSSFTVRSFSANDAASIEQIWGSGTTGGVVRIRSPRMHDQVNGIRLQKAAGYARGLLPDEAYQYLYPQDVLTFEASGGGAETDVASFLAYYDNLPGIDARLYSWDQIAARLVNILGQEVDLTASATAGQSGTGLAINTNNDQLKANVDYAILGYTTSVACHAVTITGVDTGNLPVGGPGTTEQMETRDWFLRLSKLTGKPAIPVINAANKGGTLVAVTDVAASTAVNVSLLLAELHSAS